MDQAIMCAASRLVLSPSCDQILSDSAHFNRCCTYCSWSSICCTFELIQVHSRRIGRTYPATVTAHGAGRLLSPLASPAAPLVRHHRRASESEPLYPSHRNYAAVWVPSKGSPSSRGGGNSQSESTRRWSTPRLKRPRNEPGPPCWASG